MKGDSSLAYLAVAGLGAVAGVVGSHMITQAKASALHQSIVDQMQVDDTTGLALKATCVQSGWEDRPGEPHAVTSTWLWYHGAGQIGDKSFEGVAVACMQLWGDGQVNPVAVEVGRITGNPVYVYYQGVLKISVPAGGQFYV